MPYRSYSKGLLLGFLMVIAALLVNAVLTYVNLQRLQTNNEAVQHQHYVLQELRLLLTILIDAETGQRGFLVTEDEKFLAPFESATLALESQVKSVEKLMAVDAARQAAFDELQSALDRRMNLLRELVDLQRVEGIEAVRLEIKEGDGIRAMDTVRALITQMEAKEREVLRARNAESRVSFWIALITGIITAVLGLGLAVAGYWLAGRDLEKREQLSEALQKSKERLEERVHARTMEIEASNAALRDEISVRTKAEQLAMLAAQELQRSNRELEQFASVASHDLQEPLRKIQAFGDRLRLHCQEQLGEKGADYLQRILSSAARMRKLIDDLLSYSRVSSKALPFSAVDLNEVVEEVTGDLESRLHDVGGRIEVAKLPHIEADPSQMRQLFQNLLGNALKFHRPGVPPVVTVTSQTIPASANGNGDAAPRSPASCEITIADNGIGFEQVYVDRIFELFQRLHGRDEYQGTGMGLAICRKIIERHAGTITAESVPGEGSRFVFRLPIQQTIQEPVA